MRVLVSFPSCSTQKPGFAYLLIQGLYETRRTVAETMKARFSKKPAGKDKQSQQQQTPADKSELDALVAQGKTVKEEIAQLEVCHLMFSFFPVFFRCVFFFLAFSLIVGRAVIGLDRPSMRAS